MAIERRLHGGAAVHALVSGVEARALKLPDEQPGVTFRVFRDQDPQGDPHRLTPI